MISVSIVTTPARAAFSSTFMLPRYANAPASANDDGNNLARRCCPWGPTLRCWRHLPLEDCRHPPGGSSWHKANLRQPEIELAAELAGIAPDFRLLAKKHV